jgi:hypothetical protein
MRTNPAAPSTSAAVPSQPYSPCTSTAVLLLKPGNLEVELPIVQRIIRDLRVFSLAWMVESFLALKVLYQAEKAAR